MCEADFHTESPCRIKTYFKFTKSLPAFGALPPPVQFLSPMRMRGGTHEQEIGSVGMYGRWPYRGLQRRPKHRVRPRGGKGGHHHVMMMWLQLLAVASFQTHSVSYK